MTRPGKTWIELSEKALLANQQGVAAILPTGAHVAPVVKANAYGHGLREVAGMLAGQGSEQFIVDDVGEAEVVRSVVPHGQICIVGFDDPEMRERVVAARVIPTVTSPEDIMGYATLAESMNLTQPINIEVETGFRRLGAPEENWRDLLSALKYAGRHLQLWGLSSHLYSADEKRDAAKVAEQAAIYGRAVNAFCDASFVPKFRHLGNSSVPVLHNGLSLDLVRVGLLLYGLWPSDDVRREGTLGRHHVTIAPILSLKSVIAQVQYIKPGESVGYGGSFVANKPMRIATVAAGYADGIDRRRTGQAVLVRGIRCPIIGRICMNMLMIDVSNTAGPIGPGDVVTIIGRDGMAEITVDDIARDLGTLSYEVVARLPVHLPRVIV